MCTGRCPASCTRYSPKSVSTARIPSAASTWFSSSSSLTMDLAFTTVRTLFSLAIRSTWRLASSTLSA